MKTLLLLLLLSFPASPYAPPVDAPRAAGHELDKPEKMCEQGRRAWLRDPRDPNNWIPVFHRKRWVEKSNEFVGCWLSSLDKVGF